MKDTDGSPYENRLLGRKMCASTCPQRPEHGCGRPENELWSSSGRPEIGLIQYNFFIAKYLCFLTHIGFRDIMKRLCPQDN